MSKRAGQRVLKTTRSERLAYIRRNWWLFARVTVLFAAMAAGFIGLVWLVFPAAVLVFVGAFIVGYAWLMVAALDATDGTFLRRQGGAAEVLTREQLRPLLRQGWALIDAVEFRSLDVDHVLIGPGGVWAIETKTSMVPMTMRPDRVDGLYKGDPCAQARSGARKIAALLRSYDLDLNVTAAVVLWGHGAPEIPGGYTDLPSDYGTVTVFSGREMRNSLERFGTSKLDIGSIEACRHVIEQFVEIRDDYEAAR